MEVSSRSLRQEECVENWVRSGCRGSIEAITGWNLK